MTKNEKQHISNTRTKRAKLNIVFSLLGQFVALICGFIVPRLLIKTFGSEAYGATASILQFLSYIVLLEGGIGGVARAALYKPLAEKNYFEITEILNETKFLFKMIGYAFAVYVLVIACSFKEISHFQYYDWFSTFILVIVISSSIFMQYFLGISYAILLQADQKSYIPRIINTSTLVLSTILVVILVSCGCGLITIKFISALIFICRPIIMYLYVHQYYPLAQNCTRNKNALSQKWSGLGQHLAFFFHSNTDVVILTLFTNLKIVAVYAIYNMVVSHVQEIITSFTTGMEALFGDMLARKEISKLNRVFGYYETLISLIALPFFSVTILLIISFVRLYIGNVTDVNYIRPFFAVILILSALIYCLRSPYHSVTIAAGHFKQTQIAAYGEAIINVGLSIVLVHRLGLLGVAVGTLIAVSFRFLYYVFYLSHTLLDRPVKLFVKRAIINTINIFLICFIGYILLSKYDITNYLRWVIAGVALTGMAVIISLGFSYVYYREDFKSIFKHIKFKF